MAERQLRLLPGSPESVVLIGAIAPTSASPGRTLLVTSPISERSFDEEDRTGLERFARLQSLNDAIAAMESVGGDAADVDDWVEAGLLAKFPGSFTPTDFLDFFEGFALVWLTRGIAAAVEGDEILLAVPNTDGIVAISPLLYALLQRSNGDVDLPTLLREAVGNDPEALEEFTAEVIVKLRFLVNTGIAAVIRSS